MKHRVSIKYKLLALLILLPVCSLLLYLLLAVKLFESDKIAYVFDSGAAISKTLAAQTTSELNSILSSIRPILEGYEASSQHFDKTSKALFERDEALKSLSLYRSEHGRVFTKITGIEKIKPPATNEDVQELASAACAHDISIKILAQDPADPKAGEMLYLGTCQKTDSKDTRVAALAWVNGRTLLESFQKTSTYSSYAVGPDGRQILGPDLGQPVNFSAWSFFKSLDPERAGTGVTTATSPSGMELLISHSHTNLGKFWVISIVEKRAALRAVEVLVWKSILFLLALVSLGTIISVFASNKLTATLRELAAGTLKVSEGQFNINVAVRSQDEVGDLAVSFNRMASEVSRLMREVVQKARMEKELETARMVQETLFPTPTAQIGNLKIGGYFEPASECGGDWWYYNEIAGKVFLWIGDVTGHGVSSALLTSAACSAASVMQSLPEVTPALGLELMNRAVFDSSKGTMQMTFFLGAFDPKTLEFSYSKASHTPPFLVRRKGNNPSREDILPLDEVNSPRLGEKRDQKFSQAKIDLTPEDVIWFYTDGVLDVADPSGKLWGERALIKELIGEESDLREPQAILTSIKTVTQKFRKGQPLTTT